MSNYNISHILNLSKIPSSLKFFKYVNVILDRYFQDYLFRKYRHEPLSGFGFVVFCCIITARV